MPAPPAKPSALFSPYKLRDIEFKNRIWVSPMCQYSCEDGLVNNWHLVHLGSRAVGGAALVMAEATAVCPEGRISPQDAGIWDEKHMQAFQPITRFIPAIQLAHAGRKASTPRPWTPGPDKAVPPERGGWQPLAPSALPFAPGYPHPREMSQQDIDAVVEAFQVATQRSLRAGFQVVELHMAHGYLLHSFLSPLSNSRTDAYGGSLANRMRLPLRVARAARDAWPSGLPLVVRISASDWVPGGWDLEQSVVFARELKALGVDLVDCSSGGASPKQLISVAPGYQVPFAAAIKEQVGIPTGAVGLITEAHQAEAIISQGKADVVLLARELLRDPYWPLHAAHSLGHNVRWPDQYDRAKPKL